MAVAQNTPDSAIPTAQTHVTVPDGYTLHQAIDLGGRMANVTGSPAMYDTLVNYQSGPRIQGESFILRALPGTKNTWVDNLSAFGSGFGGDPYSFARLNAAKGKAYEFTGIFRRDRQYMDYNLLGNPNIPGGQTIPIGPSSAPTGTFAWPQVTDSPFLFNTVRRMTDTSLTIHPLSEWTYRFGYSQNIMQGPTVSPSGYQVGSAYALLLQEYERNSTDDFFGALDWKPTQTTKVSFEEQIDHYKGNSYFTLDPANLMAQEADGTKVAFLTSYFNLSPYGASSCNTASMGGNPLLTAATTGNLPVINAACSVATSYLRTQPTRVLLPTEILRLQSSAIKNVAMNGDVRYTQANMNLPAYADTFNGLNASATSKTATKSIAYLGNASAKREVVAIDYGILWQAMPRFSLSEQVTFSNTHEPGTANMLSGTTVTTASGTPQTINSTQLTTTSAATGASTFEGSPAIGTPLPDFFGQKFVTNNVTGTWDASGSAVLSLTYRYSTHTIAEGIPDNAPLAVGQTSNGTVTIDENGGILNAALRPAHNWDVNGTVEIAYANNAFTPVAPRQLKRYRVHTIYKPAGWATINGSFNDVERHNNTNNNAAAVAAGDDPYEGPLDHVDHNRIVSVGAVIAKSEHYGFDFNYSYSDVYSATNICFDNGNQTSTAKPGTYPGTATLTASGAPNVCPGVFGRGSTTQLADWFGRDFMNAPTQYGYAAVMLTPTPKVKSDIGYTVSAVNGTRFFNDARDVNGSLVSTYESPYVDLAYSMRPTLVWKAQYNFYGYGEGGPSGPQYCSLSTSTTSEVLPCTSFTGVTGVTGLTGPAWGQTAPRNFHANNVILGVHYEF
ncbi:MAG TPA: hypothetical protein VMD29_05375 [Terracidiphilus sp.]|nr:hypothetical protein [Terracidiphilus sp.]